MGRDPPCEDLRVRTGMARCGNCGPRSAFAGIQRVDHAAIESNRPQHPAGPARHRPRTHRARLASCHATRASRPCVSRASCPRVPGPSRPCSLVPGSGDRPMSGSERRVLAVASTGRMPCATHGRDAHATLDDAGVHAWPPAMACRVASAGRRMGSSTPCTAPLTMLSRPSRTDCTACLIPFCRLMSSMAASRSARAEPSRRFPARSARRRSSAASPGGGGRRGGPRLQPGPAPVAEKIELAK